MAHVDYTLQNLNCLHLFFLKIVNFNTVSCFYTDIIIIITKYSVFSDWRWSHNWRYETTHRYFGNPFECSSHSIIIEKTEVCKGIKNFAEAVCIFCAYIIYVLNLRYNSKNTYEFIQKVLMKIDAKNSIIEEHLTKWYKSVLL